MRSGTASVMSRGRVKTTTTKDIHGRVVLWSNSVFTLLWGKTDRHMGHSLANTLLINSLSWDSRTACTTSSRE